MFATEIDNWFQYHAPTANTLIAYKHIRDAGKLFAQIVDKYVPDGADKTATMRKIRETVMSANQAVACAPNADEWIKNSVPTA